MTDVVLVVVIIAFFVAAALLVRVLDRMIATEADEADPSDAESPEDVSARELTPGRRA